MGCRKCWEIGRWGEGGLPPTPESTSWALPQFRGNFFKGGSTWPCSVLVTTTPLWPEVLKLLSRCLSLTFWLRFQSKRNVS